MSSKGRKTRLAHKLAFFILSFTTLIFAAAFTYNYFSSKGLVLQKVEETVRNLTQAKVNRIETVLKSVEQVPEFMAMTLERRDLTREELLSSLSDMVVSGEYIFGGLAAFEPYAFDPEQLYFAPYFYKEDAGVVSTFFGDENSPYTVLDWYLIPKELDAPLWSEPYFDEGGGNIIMATFSVPFKKKIHGQRQFSGVVTADISLEWLVDIVSSVSAFQTGYAFLISGNGVFVSHPDKSLLMRESIFSLAESLEDLELRGIGRDMIHGGEGFVPVSGLTEGKDSWLYYAPVSSSGWSLGVVFPEDELFADVETLSRDVLIIAVVGFVFLFAVVTLIVSRITRPLRYLAATTGEIAKGNLDIELPRTRSADEVGELSTSFNNMRLALKEYIANLTETTRAKERIESELKIARTIQMSFLPKKFPPFPERDEFEIFAALEPAKEVGGDLYDFFLLDEEHLFFSVGDVSDKGVPAALFMAVTKTLIKGTAEQDLPPSEILQRVNEELCLENESNMFVTLVCGILNLRTGEVSYSNAGHNPPLILRKDSDPEWLQLPPGLVLGAMEGMSYETRKVRLNPGDRLLVYTDGVSEAMDETKGIYSDERLFETVKRSENRGAEDLIGTILNSVKAYSGAAPQSDDITLLALRYHGSRKGH